MSKNLKVYGWTGARSESRGEGNHHGQTREIVAAASVAEVLRLTGMSRGSFNNYGCETDNAEERVLALSKPGVVFWQPLSYAAADRSWHEVQQ